MKSIENINVGKIIHVLKMLCRPKKIQVTSLVFLFEDF